MPTDETPQRGVGGQTSSPVATLTLGKGGAPTLVRPQTAEERRSVTAPEEEEGETKDGEEEYIVGFEGAVRRH